MNNWFFFIFIALYTINYQIPYAQALICPDKCKICVTESLTCNDKHNPRTTLPQYISQTVYRLYLRDQPFTISIIKSSNFTQFRPPSISLRQLSLHNCNIRLIESETFSTLTKLETLDLSANINMTIEKDVFKGLKLRTLLINDINNLILDDYSFRGLEVTSLSLKQSGLKTITYTQLFPLIKSLKKLFLYKNNIHILQPKVGLILRHLLILDLTENPLHCNCKLKWLIEMYKQRINNNKDDFNAPSIDSIDRLLPTCATPSHIKYRSIINVQTSELICDSPQITNLNLKLHDLQSELICSGRQDAINAPLQISWISTNGETITESFIKQIKPTKSIIIKRDNKMSQYYCIVNNTLGSVTASVKINWPSFPSINNDNNNNKLNQNQKSWYNIFFDRRFTLLEILLAIFGTIITTGLLFILIHKFVFARCLELECHNKKKQFEKCSSPQSNLASVSLTTSCDPQIYSNSQTYDQPGLPYSTSQIYLPTTGIIPCNGGTAIHNSTLNKSNSCINQNNSYQEQPQFLDFKTQKKIYRPL